MITDYHYVLSLTSSSSELIDVELDVQLDVQLELHHVTWIIASQTRLTKCSAVIFTVMSLSPA